MTIPETGCPEYRELSRRSLLGTLATGWLPKVVYTEDADFGPPAQSQRDILVTIFLRGGADGLILCPPWKDNTYQLLRSETLVKPPTDPDPYKKGLDLDGFFGLPQAMSPLEELFKSKFLLFAHQTGSTDPTHSHFDAQQFMEVGSPSKDIYVGWVGRHLASVAQQTPGAMFRSISLGAAVPLLQQGTPKSTAIFDLTDVTLGGNPYTLPQRLSWLNAVYAGQDPGLVNGAGNVPKTVTLLKQINFANYKPTGGAVYNPPSTTVVNGKTVSLPQTEPGHTLGTSLSAAAAILKSQIGVESIHIDYGGWDMHQNADLFEARNDAGGAYFGIGFMQLRGLAANLLAFFKDMDSVPTGTGTTMMNRITIVVMTEFGRTLKENGNLGLDHGHGGAMMFLGRNVVGGRVDRSWQPLTSTGVDAAGTGLAVSVDYRILLGELLEKRLLNGAQLSTVFPGFKKPVTGWRGLFK